MVTGTRTVCTAHLVHWVPRAPREKLLERLFHKDGVCARVRLLDFLLHILQGSGGGILSEDEGVIEICKHLVPIKEQPLAKLVLRPCAGPCAQKKAENDLIVCSTQLCN